MSESIRYCVKDTKAVLGGSWDPKTRIRTVESNRAPYKVISISRLHFSAAPTCFRDLNNSSLKVLPLFASYLEIFVRARKDPGEWAHRVESRQANGRVPYQMLKSGVLVYLLPSKLYLQH